MSLNAKGYKNKMHSHRQDERYSELQGQEEAACAHVFRPTQPLQPSVSYLHGWQL